MNKREIGNRGEDCAVEFLKNNGYEILNRNFYTRKGEIDIVAKDGDSVVFIEVKTRKNNNYGSAAEAVNAAKQKKLALTAQAYMNYKNLTDSNLRFDVIEVDSENNSFAVKNHIKNAFEV